MSMFSIATKVFFGTTGLSESMEFMIGCGLNKIAVIIDSNLADLQIFVELISKIKQSGLQIETIKPYAANHEPYYDELDDFTDELRVLNVNAIMAIGGGSILDLAKGVGILLKNPGKGIDYRGMNKVINPGIPVICIPSTAGTGSEVTHTASFIDRESKTKLGINGRYVTPLLGLLLPEMTFSCPAKVTIHSGLDAMLHAMEAVTAKTATPITALLGCQAFAILYGNFRKAVFQPDHYEARDGMLLGSYLAGIAMMNAGGGPASGISYPMGVHFGVPHGLAGGIFIPHVVDYNIAKGYFAYDQMYRCLPDADIFLKRDAGCIDFARKLKQLYLDIHVPDNLNSYGFFEKDIPAMTKLTIEQRMPNLELNPVSFGMEDVIDILRKIV
jgi:alcohol dehydrogenase